MVRDGDVKIAAGNLARPWPQDEKSEGSGTRSGAQNRAAPMAPAQSGPRKMKNAPDATSTKPMA
jgi:hypothetical protein